MPARDAIASDSDSEMATVSKKHITKNDVTPSDEEPPTKDAEDDEDEEDAGEEYEIEAILDARKGAFPEGRFGFLVKWKGYDTSHNSWVDELDAGNASGLITEFMRKRGLRRKSNKGKTDSEPKSESKKRRGRPSQTRTESPDKDAKDVSDEDTRPKSTKRAKNNLTATSSKQRKERLSSQPPEVSQDDLIGMDKWMTVKNWDDLVQQIDTIERDGETLYVYFTLTTGEHAKEHADVCHKKFPQKLLSFYESHLHWKQAGESSTD